jgi:hypothetical protein
MGKYLDIAKKAETRLEKEGQLLSQRPATPDQQALSSRPDYRALYREMAEMVQNDCFLIDPYWLIDAHPELWEEIKALDYSLSQLEPARVAELEYRDALDCLFAVVRGARALYERERSDEPARQ